MRNLIITKNKSTKEFLQKKFPELKNEKTKTRAQLTKQDFKNKDIIISVGGDGTFLAAAHYTTSQKILGVNSDSKKSEGALLSIPLSKLKEKISEIKSNKYKTEKLTRAQVKIFSDNHCVKTEDALNDIYLGNKNPHHTSNYEIHFQKKSELQKSSGVVISTGTGSTAWFKSMGGTPFPKSKQQLRFKIREPYTRNIHKTTISKGRINPNQKLTINSKMNHGLVAIDSIKTYSLKRNDTIEVSIGNPLDVIL